MGDSVEVSIGGNVYNWLSISCFRLLASLPYMSICAGVVVAVTFQKVDDPPYAKAGPQGNHEYF